MILGFTRGGFILAGILSAQLSDEFADKYSSPTKAAMRSIPNGIHKKTYDRATFVMGKACDDLDSDDLEQLREELREFREKNRLDRLSVLMVDDNLTGSTRMRYFVVNLNDLDFLDIDLLAYSRGVDFTIPPLDYIIRSEPIAPEKYLIMPWHKENPATQIPTRYSHASFRLNYTIHPGVTIEDLERLIIDNLPLDDRPSEISVRKDTLTFKRGETIVHIRLNKEKISLKFQGHLFYPPKDCLNKNPPAFGERSLCKLGGLELSGQICRYCSALFCSRDILHVLEQSAGATYTGAELIQEEDEFEPILGDIAVIDRWMSEPLKGIDDLRFSSLESFLLLDVEEQIDLKELIEDKYEKWIDDQLDKYKAAWIVTLGDRVILHSDDLFSAPDLEDVLPSGREADLVPYLFLRSWPIEEGPGVQWNKLGPIYHFDDWYPTIRLRVSNPRSPGQDGLEFTADFDTGNPFIHMDAKVLYDEGIIDWFNYFISQRPRRHIGHSYRYCLAPVHIEILDGDPPVEGFTTMVMCVRNWQDSPFVDQNPERTAFVGRQIFTFGKLRTVLDGVEKMTFIEGK